MKKLFNTLLAASMLIGTISVTGPIFAFDAPEMNFSENRNYALDGSASASKSPISYWGPDKLIDGIINRDADKPEQSRWSSEAGAPGWIKVDLKEARTFKQFQCAFENEKVRKFHIEVSDDDQTYRNIFTSEDKTDGHAMDTLVTLEEKVTARYVKLTVDALITGAYPSVSMYEFEILGEEDFVNFAPEAVATSNHTEGYGFTADKTNDNSFDTKSRWSSDFEDGENILTYMFEEEKTLASIILEWERCNATTYHIQVLQDGTWVTVKDLTLPKNFSDRINLDAPVTTKGVQIVIDGFVSAAPDRDGKDIDYPTVSLFEVGMYDKALTLEPEKVVTAADIANGLTVEPLGDHDTALTMPSVPEGFEISFTGADYEQIVNRDLSITKPLTAQDVVVNFEVSKTTTDGEGNEVIDKASSPAITLTVPGMYDAQASKNEKPEVLPEIQQWFGHEGDFEINDNSRIVVDPSAAAFLESAQLFAADYKDILKKDIEVVTASDPQKGDFYFTLSDEELDEETYVMEVADFVTIKANHSTGAYWSTRSILQILKQTQKTIAKGIAKDYPKYEVRGFMLDVARRPFKIEFLQDLVKTMSWYKLSNFHIHLNDNCFGKLEDNKTPDYSGFRIESDVPNLTNTDYYYTKDEFRDFIKSSKKLGVNIVPEFDTPGHSGAFIRARPDLARADSNEYLDVENPESLEFVESVFAEYTSGDDPVFPKGTVVHVGTDEYKRGNKEAFRKFQDGLLRFMRDEQGYTPRVWGSQTENSGTTPITVDGIQMNLWYVGYANPREMYEKGYDCINTNDGDLYIVPGAGYYYDYLNQSHIYGDWQPNKIGNFTIPVGSQQMLGSTFAVWNDKTGPSNDNGTSDIEVFDRIFHIVPTFASKLWGDIRDYSIQDINDLSSKITYAPNSNPTYEVESVDSTVIDFNFNTDKGMDKSGNAYDLIKQVNVSYGEGKNRNALALHGEESYVETPVEDLGINSELEFWIKRDADSGDEEQILFESENGAIKAVQKESGKFGFSRQWHDYSFDYELPKEEWVKIKLETSFTVTKLYVNDELQDTLAIDKTGKKWASLVIPLQRIGSTTHAFKGKIDDVVVAKNVVEYKATATSEQSSDKAMNAVDGNPNTIWHTKWDGSDKLPQSITLEMPKTTEINGFNYLPRQSGTNGYILQYTIEVSEDGKNFTKVAEGNWASNADEKHVTFDPCLARFVRLTALDGVGGFASAAEINVTKSGPDVDKLNKLIAQALKLEENDYTPASWNVFKNALKDAQSIAEDKEASQEEVDAVLAVLDTAMEDLVERGAANIDDLVAAYQECLDLEKTAYTQSTWAKLETAIESAKAVLESQDPSNEAIENAISALKTAREGLIKKASEKTIAALQQACDGLEALRGNYTSEEFKDAQTAIENAKAVLNNAADEIALQDAQNALMTIAIAKDQLNHNVMLEALKVLHQQAIRILSSDEIDTVRPGKVQALRDAATAAQKLIDENSTDKAVIAAAQNNMYKAIQELYQIVDKNMLKALAASARAMNENQYTPESWAAMITMIEDADLLVHDKDATKEAVEQCYDALTRAIINLQIKLDKKALEEQLKIAHKVLDHDKDYIPSTILGLADVVAEADVVNQNPNATQAEINAAAEKLIHALAQARLKADKTVLETALAEAARFDLRNYDASSVQGFRSAYAQAQQVFDDEFATQKEINLAAQKLQDAISDLVKADIGSSKNHTQNSASTPQGSVNTGDTSTLAWMSMLVLLSGAFVCFYRKRKNAIK